MALEAKTILFDYDLNGGTDNQGNIKEVYNSDALGNALKMWLLSSAGDYIGEVSRGGPLVPYLDKPMNDETKQLMTLTITEALTTDFPEIKIVTFTIDPNYEKKYWSLELVGYSDIHKIGFVVQEKVRSFN
ncbi:MAG: hypothetical protein GF311_28525 [Candidatus Lokiarchaeota archaeon]|nr:hypothetical protein [Candidatus Lokiarchaeota archaeon]